MFFNNFENILIFRYCLTKELHLESADFSALVLIIFKNYLSLVHKLLKIYLLEPAGSHGVWGLDDYHFLPYLFGASQSIGHPYLKPKSIFNQDIVSIYGANNLYFMMVLFVGETKRFSLKWNSPMLNDISLVNDWRKVFNGLLKMYKSEVLSKLPIMQHFMFGNVLDFTPKEQKEEKEIVRHEFQSCCASIKIPSIYYTEHKELPFD